MATLNRVRTVWAGVVGAPYYANHYFTDDSTNVTAQAAIDAVDAFWTSIAGVIANTATYVVEGTVARIDEATGTLLGNWGLTQGVGGGAGSGELLPRQTQALLRWLTPSVVGGRVLRGRTFIPALLEQFNDSGGNPVSSVVSGLNTAGAALIADPDCELRVWSRTHGTSDVVTSANAWTQWATLRSRRS